MTRTTLIALFAAGALSISAGAALARGHQMSFDALDTDGDGRITQAEMDMLRDARFQDADANQDGTLDASELNARAMARAEERTKRMIERMDSDGDGKLSREELSEREGRRGAMFSRADANGDGAITRAEFDDAREKMQARMKEHRGAKN
jgi:Ca2+-binding EF-hand superfamily protein